MYGDCNSPNGCSKCKKKHHTLLHRDFTRINHRNQSQLNVTSRLENQDTAVKQIQSANCVDPSGVVQSHHTSVAKKVMLATAWVNVLSIDSYYKVRALIDPCSDESFISEKMQKLLKLPTSPISAEVTGLGGDIISRSHKLATFVIASLFNQNVSLNIQALVVPRVTGSVPTHSFVPSSINEIPDLEYADPQFYESSEIDLLLGGDLYPLIIREGVQHGILGILVAQESIFGWIVTGPTPSNVSPRCVTLSHMTRVSVNDLLAKFLELEEVFRKKV